jgi:hypothetical protein
MTSHPAGIRARSLLALALSIMPLAALSCSEIQPVVPVEDRRMVVIPMRDAVSYYYESSTGNTLAKLVCEHLQAVRADSSDCVDVVPFDDLVLAVRDVDPKNMKFTEVARRVKADLILVGNITRFETRREGDVGFIRGRCDVDVSVVETTHPEKPLYRKQISVTFPPENYHEWGGYSGDEGSEADIKVGLLALATKKISMLFYSHDPDLEKDK